MARNIHAYIHIILLCDTQLNHTHQCTGEQDMKLRSAKLEIEAKWQRKMERVKDVISQKLLNSLDRDGQAEMVDNGWLKREVVYV